jgi:tetratricopeptide (TPR) repeat protein
MVDLGCMKNASGAEFRLYFEDLYKEDPANQLACIGRGLKYFSRCEFDEALSYFKQGVNLLPKFDFIHLFLADTYYELEIWDLAIENYENSLKYNSNNSISVESYIGLGKSKYKLQLYREAAHCFDLALHLDRECADLYFHKANALRKMGEFIKSEIYYVVALILDPMCDDCWNNRGLLYGQLGKYKQAIFCYDKSLLVTENKRAYNNKGEALEKLGNYKAALLCYKDALRIDPASASVLKNKRRLMKQMKKEKKRQENLSKDLIRSRSEEGRKRNVLITSHNKPKSERKHQES